MQKDVEKLYYQVTDEFKELEDTTKANNTLQEVLDDLSGRFIESKTVNRLSDLIGDLCAETEKQGFVFGFQYAVRLFTVAEPRLEE